MPQALWIALLPVRAEVPQIANLLTGSIQQPRKPHRQFHA